MDLPGRDRLDARVAVSELIGESESDATEQGGSQISHLEFLGIRPGTARGAIEALVGEPESRHETKIEGLAIECWYYGVAGATGSYQLCFANGRLRTKSAYGMR